MEGLKGKAAIVLRIMGGESLIPRARNTLTADFLATDCTHLLFIDCDLIFSADHVARLLDHDRDIIGGFYPKKQQGEGIDWVCNAHLDFPPPNKEGLQSLRYIGTGFMMVKRQVFEKMMSAPTDLSYKADATGRLEHDFWSVGVWTGEDGSRRYLSEDWFFCQRALELGYQVLADPQVILKHIGTCVYPLKSQEKSITDNNAITMPLLSVIPNGMEKHVHRIFKGEYDPGLNGWEPKTILDIGANIGAFTVWACKKWPAANVYAFEPHPKNCEVFLRNIGGIQHAGPLNDIKLHQAAVRKEAGRSTLTEGGNCGEHSFHFPPRSKYARTHKKIEVDCIAASSIPSCEFVKIDTEGSELQILGGLNLSNTRALSIEYHRAEDRSIIGAFLRGMRETSHKRYSKHRGVLKFVRGTHPGTPA